MVQGRPRQGELVQYETPDWDPLNAFVYTESERYKPEPTARALASVFLTLTPDLFGVTPGQVAVSWEAVDRLRAAADH
jgi:hypothetical protein